MKESIANSMIFAIVMVFVGLIIVVFLSSLNYSKAYKVKNRIVDIIEQYDDGYCNNTKAITAELEGTSGQAGLLASMGYHLNLKKESCPTINDSNATNGGKAINTPTNYLYCIYRLKATRGYYYRVIAYIYFDVPFVEQLSEYAVYGETRQFYSTIDDFKESNTNVSIIKGCEN